MGILVRGPALEQGETVLWKRAANRTQSNWRYVGGFLFLTTSRLLFAPNWLDAVMAGESWSAPLAYIRRVGIEPRDWKPWKLWSGGIRARLRLDLTGGATELFVVNHVEDVVNVIRKAVGQPA